MENPVHRSSLPYIQPGMARVQRRASHRWAPEVSELVQRRPTFKHSVPEVTIHRADSRKWPMTDVTNHKPPLTRHMSHITTRHAPITLIEKTRDAVISTKLRRQKSDLEQEVKLQQAKRRRFALEKRESMRKEETASSSETLTTEVGGLGSQGERAISLKRMASQVQLQAVLIHFATVATGSAISVDH